MVFYMTAFRLDPRIVLPDPERGGGSATSQEFSNLNFNLNRLLIDADLDPVSHGQQQEFMELVAYRRGLAAPREEAVLIDNGGNWIPVKTPLASSTLGSLLGAADRGQEFAAWFRSQKGMGRILTVLIRDGLSENKALVGLVESAFLGAGLATSECRISANSNSSVAKGFKPTDVVFAVTIDCEEIDDGGLEEDRYEAPTPHPVELEHSLRD